MANDILINVGADITDFSRKMKESNDALRNFGKANQETFDAFKTTGKIVTGASTLLATSLGFAVNKAMDFESGMSKVEAISGAAGDELDSLRDKAIEMGNKTVFSATESAEAMANLAQMGWETDEMLSGIEHTLNLAAAGGIELADSALITANTMNQFGLEAWEAERIADVFALTASSAGTDVMGMGDAMQYAGANASAAGMTIEDTAAFIGVLGNAGITGSKAGTSLNAVLRDLKSSAEDGAISVGEQTVALYDAEGNMRDMPAVISEIIKATETMSTEQRDAALSVLFGDQALVGFNAIASEGANSVKDLSNELYDSKGVASDMAGVMQDNLLGSLTQLGSAFEGVVISVGTSLIPAIKKAAEWLTNLADWFNGLSEGTKRTIAIVVALATALGLVVGPMLIIIGFIPSIISGFASIVTVIKAVGAAIAFITSPIGIVIAAITFLAVLLFTYWEEILEFTVETWNAIAEFFTELWDNITEGIVLAWEAITEFFVELWEGIYEIFSSAWETIFEFLSETIEGIVEFIVERFQGLGEALYEIWEGIAQIAGGVWDLIKNVILGPVLLIYDLVTGNFEELGDHAKQIWNNIKEALSVVWEGIKNVFSGAVDAVKGYVKGAWTTMRDTISGLMSSIFDNISNAWNSIKTTVSGLVTGIKDSVVNIFSDMRDAVGDAMGKIKDKISDKWVEVVSFFKDIDLMEIGKDVIRGFTKGISSMFDGVKKTVKKITGFIPGFLKKTLGIKSPSRVLADIGRDTGAGLVVGLTDSEDAVARASERLADVATPSIDMSYQTPEGIRSTLSSAVNGTVDVNERDSMLAGAINSLERRLTGLEVKMDGEAVGRIVRPHVNEGNAIDGAVRRYFD